MFAPRIVSSRACRALSMPLTTVSPLRSEPSAASRRHAGHIRRQCRSDQRRSCPHRDALADHQRQIARTRWENAVVEGEDRADQGDVAAHLYRVECGLEMIAADVAEIDVGALGVRAVESSRGRSPAR